MNHEELILKCNDFLVSEGKIRKQVLTAMSSLLIPYDEEQPFVTEIPLDGYDRGVLEPPTITELWKEGNFLYFMYKDCDTYSYVDDLSTTDLIRTYLSMLEF